MMTTMIGKEPLLVYPQTTQQVVVGVESVECDSVWEPFVQPGFGGGASGSRPFVCV